jgi:hypothetical protein
MVDLGNVSAVEKKRRKRNKKNKKATLQPVVSVVVDDDSDEDQDAIFDYLNMSPSAQTQNQHSNQLAAQELNAYESNHMGQLYSTLQTYLSLFCIHI